MRFFPKAFERSEHPMVRPDKDRPLTDTERNTNEDIGRARLRSGLVFAAATAAFVLPIHTSYTLSTTELSVRCIRFSLVYFLELYNSIMWTNSPWHQWRIKVRIRTPKRKRRSSEG